MSDFYEIERDPYAPKMPTYALPALVCDLDAFATFVRTQLPYIEHVEFCAAIGADPDKLDAWAKGRQ
jgi:hypothetical protein